MSKFPGIYPGQAGEFFMLLDNLAFYKDEISPCGRNDKVLINQSFPGSCSQSVKVSVVMAPDWLCDTVQPCMTG